MMTSPGRHKTGGGREMIGEWPSTPTRMNMTGTDVRSSLGGREVDAVVIMSGTGEGREIAIHTGAHDDDPRFGWAIWAAMAAAAWL